MSDIHIVHGVRSAGKNNDGDVYNRLFSNSESRWMKKTAPQPIVVYMPFQNTMRWVTTRRIATPVHSGTCKKVDGRYRPLTKPPVPRQNISLPRLKGGPKKRGRTKISSEMEIREGYMKQAECLRALASNELRRRNTPIAMDEKLNFAIREGGRTVGAGVVTKIIE